MAHVGSPAAVAAHVEDHRVGPGKEAKGIHHCVPVVAAGEGGDLEIAHVPVEDLGLAHAEVQEARIAEGADAAAGRRRRLLRVAKAEMEIPVHRPQVPGHHLGELRGIRDRVVGARLLPGAQGLHDPGSRLGVHVGRLEAGDHGVEDGGPHCGSQRIVGRGRGAGPENQGQGQRAGPASVFLFHGALQGIRLS